MLVRVKRNNRPVRFAVIGQGTFAQSAVLPAFEQATGCELRAIFSQDETKLRALRRRYGVAAALGLVTSYTLGGFIHVLVVAAVVLVLVRLVQGRRVV